jgi:hypothetical protein
MNNFNTPKSADKALLISLIIVGGCAGAAAIAEQVGPISVTRISSDSKD